MSTEQDKARREDLLDRDLREMFLEETAEMDPNEGLERFMAAVAAESRGKGSWWQRLNAWLGDVGISPALASAVILAQVGVIAAMVATQPAPDVQVATLDIMRSAPGPAQQQPDFKLMVNPDADFASLAALLRANQCRIVAGPSELGELWVAVDGEKALLEIRKSLEQSSLIDDVVAHQ